jgi:hypothetical protein
VRKRPKRKGTRHLLLFLICDDQMLLFLFCSLGERRCDSKRIRQELGYSERIDKHDALRRTVVWERDHFPEKIDPEMFNYAAEDEVLAEAMKGPAPFAE